MDFLKPLRLPTRPSPAGTSSPGHRPGSQPPWGLGPRAAGQPHPGQGLAPGADPGVAAGGRRERPGPEFNHFASLGLSSLFRNIQPSEGLTLGPEFAAASFIQEMEIMAANALWHVCPRHCSQC